MNSICGRYMNYSPCCQMPYCCEGNPRPRCKLDRHYVHPNLCSIFGGHDAPYFDNRFNSLCSNQKYNKDDDKNSLGSPVGVLIGTMKLNSKGSTELHSQRFATYLKAFAQIYLTPETDWTSNIIDDLLREGQILHEESMNIGPENADEIDENESVIYNDIEMKIRKSFDLKNYLFTISMDRVKPNIPNSEDEKGEREFGYLNIELSYLQEALSSFFNHSKYCLVTAKKLYLLVWRTRGIFFILDFYGRTPSNLVTKLVSGRAVMICVRTLDNVLHLITHLSGLDDSDLLSLRVMKIVRLIQPDGKGISREYVDRVNQYQIISSDYAYLKASLHMSLNPSDPVRNRSALATNIAVLIASKIDHPGTWDKKMLDNLMCYGFFVCHQHVDCMTNAMPLNVDKFPKLLQMGDFMISYGLEMSDRRGYWRCVMNYEQSDLMSALDQCFKNNDNLLLIQIGNQVYAVMRKNTFIYLFDAYRHRIESAGGPSGDRVDEKRSTLRIYRTKQLFFSNFNQILLQSNQKSKFNIYKLLIKKIESVWMDDPTREQIVVEADDKAEIKSLNETICFEVDEVRCRNELEEISDFEEEELPETLVEADHDSDKSELDEEEGAEETEDLNIGEGDLDGG